jgi:hypothetical protein
MPYEAKYIRRALVDYLTGIRFNDPCGVSFTMKQRLGPIKLDPISCSRNFSHFSNRLNKAILRNSFTRYGNRIPMIPVSERSYTQRYHYHSVIDRPNLVSREEFQGIVTDCWERTPWGYREIDFQFGIDAGWINYITKLKTKEEYSDSIDWQNIHRDC